VGKNAQATKQGGSVEASLVSIIMPAFNAQETLAAAARSVLEQSHRTLELLIIDDCSSDATARISQELVRQDARVRPLRLDRHVGVAGARNRGIEAAYGRYIAFLDADDLWLPDKLQQQLALMQERDVSACMASYYRFLFPGQWLGVTRAPACITYPELLKGNAVGNLTGIYDCHVLGKIFQKDVFHEDYLMWLQVVRKAGRMLAVQKPLAAYRISQGSLSSNKFKSAKWTWDIYHKHLGLSATHSICLMLHYFLKAASKRL